MWEWMAEKIWMKGKTRGYETHHRGGDRIATAKGNSNWQRG